MRADAPSLDPNALDERTRDAVRAIALLRDAITRVVVGAEATVELALIAVLAEGHLLIEDVPGTGKTTLAKTLAAGLGCTFTRIQCTPDLLPSDVTGFSYFNQRTQEFEFRPGPIFGNVVLTDEINRATPRTQSAFLEAMAEASVSAEGLRRPISRPFVVVATQNPIELEGTFPLPEAQLDRFLVRASVGYPSVEDENEIVRRFSGEPIADPGAAVLDVDDVLELQRACRQVALGEAVRAYLVEIARATRSHADVRYGASPRASVNLARAARGRALLHGRAFVLPDDVKALAIPVLAHRLVLTDEAQLNNRSAAAVLADVLGDVPAPVEPLAGEVGERA